MTRRVAILASGGGSNAAALLKALAEPGFPARAVGVLTNRPGAGVLEKAAAWGVPSELLDHRAFPSREAYDAALAARLQALGADLVCMAGYLRIATPPLLEPFRGRLLNIHPSLLPKFGGAGMHGLHVHAAVLAAGERESGATVHWVEEGVDRGPIVLQEAVPVLPGDTPETLAQRVLAVEHRLYPRALRAVCGG